MRKEARSFGVRGGRVRLLAADLRELVRGEQHRQPDDAGDHGDAVACGEAHEHHDQQHERDHHVRRHIGERQLERDLVERFLALQPLSSAGPSPAATMRRNLISVIMIMIQLIAAAIVAIDIR